MPALLVGELRAAQNVAAADHHRDLAAHLLGLVDLPRDVDHFVHRDPTFAGMR